MRLLLVLLLFASIGSPAWAQSENQELDELTKKLAQLEEENADLRARLEDMTKKETVENHKQLKGAESEARVQYEVELGRQKLAELVSKEKALSVEKISLQHALNENVLVLEQRLADLTKQAAKSQEDGSSQVAIESANSMAERLAHAQIENKMRMLEAQAMLEVLEDQRAKLGKAATRSADIAKERAALLVQQRKAELEVLEQLTRSALSSKDKSARAKYLGELEIAKLAIRDAELLRQEASATADERTRSVDDRIVESAIQLAVSKQLEASLAKEAKRVSATLAQSSNARAIEAQREALQRELLALEQAKREKQQHWRSQELQLKMHVEEMQQEIERLEATRVTLLEKFGPQHPMVLGITEHLEKLKQTLKKPKQAEK